MTYPVFLGNRHDDRVSSYGDLKYSCLLEDPLPSRRVQTVQVVNSHDEKGKTQTRFCREKKNSIQWDSDIDALQCGR